MRALRYLIVNADDFGLSPGINRGIVQAHEEGIVTSASLMVHRPAAEEAASYARQRAALSVGLHFDLCEWTYADDTWHLVRETVPVEDATAVAGEFARQLEDFRRLVGREPTHLDSHQHVHHTEPTRSILLAEARRLKVVLRGLDPRVRYCGDFYGQSNTGYPYPEGISLDALLDTLRTLPPGVTELGCHPGDGSPVDGMYATERGLELETLRDPRVRALLSAEGIVLWSFHDRRANASAVSTAD
jgi:predicted glycoside hydrolase/deacetylase ChbG (UPF0249 family)